jgi:hypothetical protein
MVLVDYITYERVLIGYFSPYKFISLLQCQIQCCKRNIDCAPIACLLMELLQLATFLLDKDDVPTLEAATCLSSSSSPSHIVSVVG